LDAEPIDILVKILGAQARMLRLGATGLNLAFAPVNLIRDLSDAFVGTYTEDGVKGLAEYISSFPQAMSSVLKKDDLYKSWISEGGGQSTFISQLLENRTKTVEELAGKTPFIKKVFSTPRDAIEFVNSVIEKAPRLATYKAQLKLGKEPAEAAFRSRDITVDFAKSGDAIKLINQIVPFLNASIQGTNRLFSLIKKNPIRAMAGITTMATAPSIALYLHNRKFNDYFDIPEYQRKDNWVFLARDRTEEERTNGEMPIGFMIPKGRYLSPFAAVAEHFLQFSDQKDPQSLTDLITGIGEDVSPIGVKPGSVLSRVLPPLAKVGIETYTNKNLYTGKEVEPEYIGGVPRENLPEQYRTQPYTGEAAKKMSEFIAGKGEAPLSPADIENVVGGTTGGLGKQLLLLADLMFGGKTPETKRLPLLSSFIGIRGGAKKSREFEEARTVAKEEGVEDLQSYRKAESIFTQIKKSPDNGKSIVLEGIKNGDIDEGVAKKLNNLIKKGGRSEASTVLASLTSNEAKARYIIDRLKRELTNSQNYEFY